MADREATSLCGQLHLEVTGEPFAVSICNCLACQRRTGSAFGMQAGFKADQVQVNGRHSEYSRISDEADRKGARPPLLSGLRLAGLLHRTRGARSGLVAVSAFADPSFPPPIESGYDSRRHPWVELPDSIRRLAPELWWDSAKPLYEEGKYAEAADTGLELHQGPPGQPYLYYNVACCESLAGRTDDAIEHLGQAIDMWDGCRDMAKEDSDFEPIRNASAFQDLIGR